MTFCRLEFEFLILLQNGELGVAAVAPFSISQPLVERHNYEIIKRQR
jgi:hypothetical protein